MLVLLCCLFCSSAAAIVAITRRKHDDNDALWIKEVQPHYNVVVPPLGTGVRGSESSRKLMTMATKSGIPGSSVSPRSSAAGGLAGGVPGTTSSFAQNAARPGVEQQASMYVQARNKYTKGFEAGIKNAMEQVKAAKARGEQTPLLRAYPPGQGQ
jgi:hypothetical protein